MIIRKCCKEDARKVGILHYHCWQETYRGLISDAFLDTMSEENSANKKEEQFDMYGKYWYVVEEDQRLIGFISIHASNMPYAKHEVEALYLRKQFHGKGYGKKMFAFINELFNNEPFCLWCLKTNPTLGFYEHMGGIIVDRKHESIGEEVCLVFNKINKEHIHKVLKQYPITSYSLDKVIDTSHGDDDIRLNILVDNMYVLKMNSTEMISESFLQGINVLIEKYKSIGVWCPTILKNKEGNLLTIIELHNQTFYCYLEEKAHYSFYEEKDMYAFKKKMLPHVGKLAHLYSNQDLMNHYSMFSILDLGSMCKDIDEKQENLDDLTKVLTNKGFKELADVLQEKNTMVRNLLQKQYQRLPRCVYQGDLNPSNILVDQNNSFVGMIDFNMYGTDVNINYFINESIYYMQKEDFDFSIEDILEKSESTMEELLGCILQEYTLNDLEKELLPYYKFITTISFYPNVQLWISLLEENVHVSKVIELLNTYIRNVAD